MKRLLVLISLSSFIYIVAQFPFTSQWDELADWQYSDLRLIDPVDTINPHQDIVAVLCRQHDDLLQVRVDFLNLLVTRDYDLFILVDMYPEETSGLRNQAEITVLPGWDTLVKYTSLGDLSIVNDHYEELNNYKLRATSDINQDSIMISIGSDDVSSANTFHLAVQVTDPNTGLIVDQTDIFRTTQIPPLPIKTAFVFWNVMDGSTAASILRSWAGAHSGPQSARHGLSYLIDAALALDIPINICGIDDSQNVTSALQYIWEWDVVSMMEEVGIIYGLQECGNGYAQYQDFPDNLSPDKMYMAILSFLLTQNEYNKVKPTIYGEDLSISRLGNPEVIFALFTYIRAHPWIQVIGITEQDAQIRSVVSIPLPDSPEAYTIPFSTLGTSISSEMSVLDIQNSIEAALYYFPTNEVSSYARFIYQNLLESDRPNVSAARGSYLSLIGHFLAAVLWSEDPQNKHDCTTDIDWDGQPECVLSSNRIFLTIELDGGYLGYAFIINSSGIHQILGSTTQFGVLRSDPSEIEPTIGLIGDSGQIPGSFADSKHDWQLYSAISSSNRIELISHDGNTQKLFILDHNFIQVSAYNAYNEIQMLIPLVIDPWLRYENDWSNQYWQRLAPQTISWGVADLVSVTITSPIEFTSSTFNASRYALVTPEDPNYDYTPGHLLPLTMAMIEFPPVNQFTIDIVVDSE